jgi:hypothetical protein
MEKSTLDMVFDIINSMKKPPKIIKDRSGYFHLLYNGGKRQVGFFHTMNDVLDSLNEEIEGRKIMEKVGEK